MKFVFICIFLFSGSLALSAPPSLIKYNYAPGEMMGLADEAIKKLNEEVDSLLRIPKQKRNFKNTLAALEGAYAEFMDVSNSLDFMSSVSTSESIRAEAIEISKKVASFLVDLNARRDLYDAEMDAIRNQDRTQLNEAELKLLKDTVKELRERGFSLPPEKFAELNRLRIEHAHKSEEFGNNIIEDKTALSFSGEELKGAPEDFILSLKMDATGRLNVPVNGPNYTTIMDTVDNSEVRRQMLVAYERRAPQNIELLKSILEIRIKIANLLGYKTWAEYVIGDRMAKKPEVAMKFLSDLESKMAPRRDADVALLLKYKKNQDPKATKLEPWDVRYLEYQIKKKFFADEETVREYFPSDRVMSKIFEIYSKLLGVSFAEVKGADVWEASVKLYEVKNVRSGKAIAYFYADTIPRPGKYTHAAAFGVYMGRGSARNYSIPVASIVSNFSPPANGKPSLMKHDEVVTLFHEFGHVMHQVLTRAKYVSQAGTSVARDFVETPSQLLENWAWDPTILKQLSGHYKDGSPLSDELIKKMIEGKDFNSGYFYSRQLLFGKFDFALHAADKPVKNPTQVFRDLYKETLRLDPMEESLFPASFGHLMGYAAGYYGYLWSEVYAADLFTVFEKEGLLNSSTGARYRKAILEKGGSREPKDLLKDFLGRPPNNKAFLKSLLGNKCGEEMEKLLSPTSFNSN